MAPVAATGRLGAFLASRPSPEDLGISSWRELHLKLIERFAPASIVVTADFEMVHISARAGRYLRHGAGEPSNSLLLAVEPALTGDLRTALLRARDTDEVVETPPILFEGDGAAGSVQIHVARADDVATGFLLVTFVPLAENIVRRPPSSTPEDDAYLRRLQQQVDELKWHLRDVTEQGTVTAQELKASNEELQAMNEELRSATEELETSREELQSINEELTTVNQELKGKVDELSRANGDLQNLMAATAIATVFLDRSLCISLFTPSAVELFNLIQADVGRPISDLANRLDYPQLNADATAVLDNLAPIEREVRFGERWLLARLRPYRSGDDRISGVVLTFVDISERRRVSEALRESEALFRTIVTQAAAGVAHIDLDGRITLVNARFALIAGHTPEPLVGTRECDLVHPGRPGEERRGVRPPRRRRRTVRDGEALRARRRLGRLGERLGDGGARRRRSADGGDRDRPRRQRPPPHRAGAARVGGAAAPDRRQRARIRDPHPRPEAAHHRLEQRRRKPARLCRRGSDRRKRRHHLHRGGPRRGRAATRGRAGDRPRAVPPTSAGTAGRTARASGAAA